MFGEAETGGSDDGGYQVLARKYRPKLFSDLIGQEAMVRTLSNAFETGRIAHAFMLTGVRGVGKTTTARLLARALNYRTSDEDAPSLTLDPPGEHCQAIMESRHPDVLELDAASRTGVADMRDLLDGARYAPVSARYKVYIIDEVHMLSTAAFNALLKTLEEPPLHVKFIFATTEIRKVPVTVLSRCQRFDLKRLDPIGLAKHLGRIAEAEGVTVSEEGCALIARAAEGSVRDGLSILDQALVQHVDGETVSAAAVRDMLGLADRSGWDFVADDLIRLSDWAEPDAGRRLWSDVDFGEIELSLEDFVRENLTAYCGQGRELGYLKPMMRREVLLD
ncbi:MAG: DNA polymerase III subunit gamma/tau, partial [Pseudomonadota bacterium]